MWIWFLSESPFIPTSFPEIKIFSPVWVKMFFEPKQMRFYLNVHKILVSYAFSSCTISFCRPFDLISYSEIDGDMGRLIFLTIKALIWAVVKYIACLQTFPLVDLFPGSSPGWETKRVFLTKLKRNTCISKQLLKQNRNINVTKCEGHKPKSFMGSLFSAWLLPGDNLLVYCFGYVLGAW